MEGITRDEGRSASASTAPQGVTMLRALNIPKIPANEL